MAETLGETGRPVGAGRVLRAARVVHPFPTLANVVAVALFAVVAWHGVPPVWALLRLLAVMFLIQCAIGAANDAVDADLDRAAKPWKPIVCGALSRRAGWAVAAVAGLGAALLAATFGPAAWLTAMGGLTCGLAYDLRLKRTAYSVVPYLIALPLLPLWVWIALGRFSAGLLWEYPLGVLIGLSLYLGNTAPDIAADLAAGVRGAAHRLGLRRTLVGSWAAFGASIGLGVALAPLAGYRLRLVAPAGAAALVCLVGAATVSRGASAEGLRRAWGLLIAGSLLFGLGWLAAAP